jgi:heme exporter protein CcmD
VAVTADDRGEQNILWCQSARPGPVDLVTTRPAQTLGNRSNDKETKLMSHTPFILAAYSISFVVLFWTALTPLIKSRSLMRELKTRLSLREKQS